MYAKMYRCTYLRVIIAIVSALSVLHEAIHVVLERGRDVARLQESSISIDVVVVPREEVIHLVERLVLQQRLVAVLFVFFAGRIS